MPHVPARGTDAPGMAAEGRRRRTQHPGRSRHQTNPSILPDASPPIMLMHDAEIALAKRQLQPGDRERS
jgi:hypothetical protein